MGCQVLSKQSALLTVHKYYRDDRSAKVCIVVETGQRWYGKEGLDLISRMIHRHGVDYFEIISGKDKEMIRVNYFSNSV